jgi:hypothetical protein
MLLHIPHSCATYVLSTTFVVRRSEDRPLQNPLTALTYSLAVFFGLAVATASVGLAFAGSALH